MILVIKNNEWNINRAQRLKSLYQFKLIYFRYFAIPLIALIYIHRLSLLRGQKDNQKAYDNDNNQ